MRFGLSRRGAAAAAVLTALAVAACQSPAPVEVAVAPPPPPPPPPPVSLSDSITQAAAAYQTYVREASAISSTFADGTVVQASLHKGVSYEPKQFNRGAVAYGAVAALQSPEFVAGVRTFAADPTQRQEMVARITADPAYAAALPGAENAAGLVVSALAADGGAIFRAGQAVKQAAYDVQRQKWSREHVKDRDNRLAMAKQLSATPIVAQAEHNARLMQAALTGGGLSVPPAAARPPYTPAVTRSLAVAALAALGAGADPNVELLLEENSGNYCLNLAKLNLYQCLAVSKPHYEDLFCLGQHVLMDTGQCLTKIAGPTGALYSPIPQTAPTALDAATESRPASSVTPNTQ
jgi:hypothetical protein